MLIDVCMHAHHFSHVWLFDPKDGSPPGSSVHGILQARILEWVAMPSSRGIFLTLGSNHRFLCLLLCRWILYPLSHLGSSANWFCSFQPLSHVWLFVTPWTSAHQASLSNTNSQSLPKPMSIKLVMPSNHLILCHPLLLLPLIFPSIRVFCNESALCIRWPKYWSFSFNISPSNEHPGLTSFRWIRWTGWISLQSKGLSAFQHHSSKASILLCSVFFMAQLSYPYMTIGKAIALTRQIFVSKVMSLLFNMLCRLVTAFLPRNRHFL